MLYLSARPAVAIERNQFANCDVFIASPCRSLQYPSAEFVRERIMKDCNEPNTVVVVDLKYVKSIDSTVAKVTTKSVAYRVVTCAFRISRFWPRMWF